MKPLSPTLRVKKRYLKFKIISEKPISKEDAIKTIRSKVLEVLGTLGSSQADFEIYGFDEKTQTGEIKTNHTSVNLIKGVLAMMDKINNQEIIVDVERTSGTLKSLRS